MPRTAPRRPILRRHSTATQSDPASPSPRVNCRSIGCSIPSAAGRMPPDRMAHPILRQSNATRPYGVPDLAAVECDTTVWRTRSCGSRMRHDRMAHPILRQSNATRPDLLSLFVATDLEDTPPCKKNLDVHRRKPKKLSRQCTSCARTRHSGRRFAFLICIRSAFSASASSFSKCAIFVSSSAMSSTSHTSTMAVMSPSPWPSFFPSR